MHFSMFEKVSYGLLFTALLVSGSNWIGNLLVHAEPLETSAIKIEGAGAPGDKAGDKAAGKPAETASLPEGDALSLLAGADPAAGAKKFKKCKACHSTAEGGKNKVGPNLWDIVGRAKAAGAGFKYSGALKEFGGEWTYKDLDGFLADPKGFAKGTKMSFAGLKKPADRAAVIAYLRSLSAAPKPLP